MGLGLAAFVGLAPPALVGARQALAIAQAGGLNAEGLEVIAEQLMQGTLLGSARSIDGGVGGHAARKRKPRA